MSSHSWHDQVLCASRRQITSGGSRWVVRPPLGDTSKIVQCSPHHHSKLTIIDVSTFTMHSYKPGWRIPRFPSIPRPTVPFESLILLIVWLSRLCQWLWRSPRKSSRLRHRMRSRIHAGRQSVYGWLIRPLLLMSIVLSTGLGRSSVCNHRMESSQDWLLGGIKNQRKPWNPSSRLV